MANQKTLLRLLKLIALLKQEPPKSIPFISEFLNTSERSAYRYVNLLQNVGFQIMVDKLHRYRIQDNELLSPANFNREELNFLNELLLSTGQKQPIAQTILHKLNLNSDLELTNQDIYNAKIAQHISSINRAISKNLQITLKQYQSINSQNISDRLVEPIKFTENFRSLCAFEPDTETNKYFNIERIGDVVLSDQPQMYEEQHQFSKPDVFGFSKSEETYAVKLKLSLKAKLLLNEEYPYTKAFVKATKDGRFLFETVIYNQKPLKRFYKGLQNDIEILPDTTINF